MDMAAYHRVMENQTLFTSTVTVDDLKPYFKFCETGPEFNRMVNEYMDVAMNGIQCKSHRLARYGLLKIQLSVGEIDLDTFMRETAV